MKEKFEIPNDSCDFSAAKRPQRVEPYLHSSKVFDVHPCNFSLERHAL